MHWLIFWLEQEQESQKWFLLNWFLLYNSQWYPELYHDSHRDNCKDYDNSGQGFTKRIKACNSMVYSLSSQTIDVCIIYDQVFGLFPEKLYISRDWWG